MVKRVRAEPGSPISTPGSQAREQVVRIAKMAPSILSCTPSCTSRRSDRHAALKASMPHSPLLAPG